MKMKTLFLLPILLLSLISCSSETDSVVERDGLYYEKFSDTPFTGKLTRYSNDGQLLEKGSFKNGVREGEYVFYWSREGWNGPVPTGLGRKGRYKNGKEEGEWVYYNEDGTVISRWTGTYKYGGKISD